LQTGVNKLAGVGIDIDRSLALCDASAVHMVRLADAWPVRRRSYSYDAPAVLGLGGASSEPLPEPAPGETVLRVGVSDTRRCARAYVGWLVTNPGFRSSYDAFASLWPKQIWKDAKFPAIPMSFFGESAGRSQAKS
jgi:hypothetical protein